MTSNSLVCSVRFHEGRYHGDGDWPPSPARLFQALAAGAGLSGPLHRCVRDALEWLERQSPPTICAPYARRGQRVMFYMPNNDLDAVQGDPRRIAAIRTAKKVFRPWLFNQRVPFLYLWPDVINGACNHAQTVCSLAHSLYQLGRGIDMAWACAEILDTSAAEDLIAGHEGPVYRPSGGGAGDRLATPVEGSLASIAARHAAYRHRFDVKPKGRTSTTTLRQAPRPSFRLTNYSAPLLRRLFDLREATTEFRFAPWNLCDASKLVVALRDGATKRLVAALPHRRAAIERVLIGRKPDGTNDGTTSERVRIIPLPSIGHFHADRAIRRVLVEVPGRSPLRADDVFWAFSALEPIDPDTGEVHPVLLVPVASPRMLEHFGVESVCAPRLWRTVTPAALPRAARRRRVDPRRNADEAKPGREYADEQRRAAASVIHALRHAQVDAQPDTIRVQREPFEGNGERVEPFASGTRFPNNRLWHVEIRFNEPVVGPLVIGDGRFLGLGVMAPVGTVRDLHAFAITGGLSKGAKAPAIARALRRAVMARVQETLGKGRPLPTFFSGHQSDGSPARSEKRPHLAFAFDARAKRLLIVAPHLLEHRSLSQAERQHLALLERAIEGLSLVRAGSSGLLRVRPVATAPDLDPLLRPARCWESVTDYQVNRHARAPTAPAALTSDVRTECMRRGLPAPTVEVLLVRGIRNVGLVGRLRMNFPVAIAGPLILGRTRHQGGGLFAGRHK